MQENNSEALPLASSTNKFKSNNSKLAFPSQLNNSKLAFPSQLNNPSKTSQETSLTRLGDHFLVEDVFTLVNVSCLPFQSKQNCIFLLDFW